MKKRVRSGWRTVTGPPRSICRRKIGITEPDEPSTLPNRTATKRVATSSRSAYDSISHSQTAFDWPIMFRGFAALSVEIRTKRSTSASIAASTRLRVAEDVVRHRLHRVRLEHRDVLVRGGVEDDLRDGGARRRAHPRAVAAIGEHRAHRRVLALVDELALDLEERRLALVDEHEPPAPSRASWRQSSEPIDPPAPVTITTRSFT